MTVFLLQFAVFLLQFAVFLLQVEIVTRCYPKTYCPA